MKKYIKPISESVIVCMNALMDGSPVGGGGKQNEPTPAPIRKLYV